MKTNYSVKRIKELEAISLHLFCLERNKHGLSKKERKLQNKLCILLISQETRSQHKNREIALQQMKSYLENTVC